MPQGGSLGPHSGVTCSAVGIIQELDTWVVMAHAVFQSHMHSGRELQSNVACGGCDSSPGVALTSHPSAFRTLTAHVEQQS